MINVNDILINDISFFIRLQSTLLIYQRVTMSYREYCYQNVTCPIITLIWDIPHALERIEKFQLFISKNGYRKEYFVSKNH